MATRSSDIPEAIRTKIAKEYNKSNFFDRYGQDVWLVSLITVVVLSQVFHTQLQAFYASLRANWLENRYNPLYMPIAGHVHKREGQTTEQATSENFSGAVTKTIGDVVHAMLAPLMFILQIIMALFAALLEAIQAMRAMFDNIRNSMGGLLQETMGKILAMSIPIQHFTITLMDLLQKSAGILAGSALMGTGGFFTVFSGVLNILTIVLTFLLALVVIGTVLLIAIPFYPVLEIPLAIDAAIFLLILIPYVIVKAILDDVQDSHSQFFSPGSATSPPSFPTCFLGTTRVEVQGAGMHEIRDIEPGDVLSEGGRVTATFVLTLGDQDLVNLNDVVVTGNHSVRHPKDGWITSREHDRAVPFSGERPKHVYCLATTSKRIFVNDTEFADWDDLDEYDAANLTARAGLRSGWDGDDIRKSLIESYDGSSLVVLADRSILQLRDIAPGMSLMGGGVCIGTVRVMQDQGIEHQLVVDSGHYYLNGRLVDHYDHAIEQYIDSAAAQ